MCSWRMARRLSPTRTRTRPSASWRCRGKRRNTCSSRRRRGRSKRMRGDGPSRRSILKSLTIGAAAGSVLRVIPLQAAEYAHNLIEDEKATTPAYTPKFFNAQQYKTLQALCEAIIPADEDCGGAMEGG